MIVECVECAAPSFLKVIKLPSSSFFSFNILCYIDSLFSRIRKGGGEERETDGAAADKRE